MKVNQFEYVLGNLSFALLLLSMLFYWFQASFESSDPIEIDVALADLVNTNELTESIKKSNRKVFFERFPSLAMWSANIALASMLLIRWLESGHFPLSNLYESLLFLSWSFTTIHFFLERAFYHEKMGTPALGAITSPIALFTNAFATFSLPEEMQKSSVLVPALQSNWLMMHVSVMMVSYAALLSGSLLAMAFLVIQVVASITPSHTPVPYASQGEKADRGAKSQESENNEPALWGGKPIDFGNNSLFDSKATQRIDGVDGVLVNIVGKGVGSMGVVDDKKISTELAQTLDNLSYRSIGLGFALLTIGILSGAVWANEAWGSYWSWDPKETWAFVTWLTFAFYLHTRLSRGWTGKKSAFVATLGFLIVWFCYLGVNLFGKGLHSYGWFS